MKITCIQTYLVQEGHRNLVFVKVTTDDGLEGIGEAYSVGPDEATAAVVHDFERWLVGEDPANIEHLPFRPWRRGVPIRADGSVGYI